ncbi:3' exoribonuclease family, domain 1 domain-containing protein [Toxoplasma gondii RUB]|uniref:3' exoribonuclease family, domain 1 domain-containing protein n=8 Tax=Toxoplasma gondii TaxID=5811 RepID=S7V266_TOXGG|nr:3' exoribonuclease family, domain 1 domain-containing protein [Toxoplasma gondii GT1]KAF4641725.1 3' exoribonuclease family, domain 1 domain-containing protein [Toxoplasma gondii]KFG48439.1 3' exoribonuclease family, domain 1 domain-containing protein [Toxoplasma gondii GAB2-2007-GAL-DOM2]KFG55430.1 3' exoribonuclease family, domain 1 domain-containing protein [Toxoplasma gondii FOU]KFG63649.1 3' exoribonuclease family, domain 1 domain-containing protein [Toxoplasma gondii RUB]PUA92765.1 3'
MASQQLPSDPLSTLFPSLEFLRADGRRPHELRELRFSTCVPSLLPSPSARPASASDPRKADSSVESEENNLAPFASGGVGTHADGRSLVSFGSTKVAAFVFGPRPLPAGAGNASRALVSASGGGWSERGVLEEGFDASGADSVLGQGGAAGSGGAAERASLLCRVGIAPFSGDWRADVTRSGGAAEEHEVALGVRKVVESVILADTCPRSLICLFVHVVENDGGILAASISAASLALVDAGIATKDFVAAMSCVYMPRQLTPLLDPPRAELQTGAPSLTLAMLVSSDEVSLLQLDGQVSTDVFEQMYEACAAGCREVGEAMKVTILEAASRRIRFGDRVLK